MHIQESQTRKLSSTFSRVARRASATFVKRKRTYKHSIDIAVTMSANQTTPEHHVTTVTNEMTSEHQVMLPTNPATPELLATEQEEKERKESDDSIVFFPNSRTNFGKQITIQFCNLKKFDNN